MADGASMRALVLERFGEPLALKEIPSPMPGAGQVLVRVAASGVNPLDIKISEGNADHAKPKLPAVLGLDLAGTVESVGAGVTRFKAGDEVFGLTGGIGGVQGSLAEYAAVDADLLAKKPSNLSMREAAAMPLGVITAWEGLVDRANVRKGQRALIHAGAGGVGQFAVQIARAFGADVFATVSAQKKKLVEEFGATAIDYRTTSVDQYVASCTGGLGFDIVYDTVGGSALDDSFRSVRRYTGHVLSCLGWGTHSLAPLSFRGATYSGVFTLLPLLTGEGRAHHGGILTQAASLAEQGKLRPLLDARRFTLETISEAHRLVKDGSGDGKIVVEVL